MEDDQKSFDSVEAALKHYRAQCSSLQQQLSDAEADIKDYTESSKELQDELEKELARLEQGEKEMRRGLELAQAEAEQWKTKYTTALREHTSTMTHMQKELESLRTSEKTLRTRLRDIELDNDDLEKAEREKDSSLQDLENRYGKSIERIALLEEELVNKAHMEEEAQRLKDEVRDLEEEVSVLRAQVTANAKTVVVPSIAPKTVEERDPVARTITPPPVESKMDTPTSKPSPFLTPTKPVASNADTPTISYQRPTPAPVRSMTTSSLSSLAKPSPPPPLPANFHATIQAQMGPLSRSSRAANLASAASTPKTMRKERTDAVINDMKAMTDRVKQLTTRLDSRRNLVMAGSSIPRASMSPQSAANAALARSQSSRQITASRLGKSISSSHRPRPSSRNDNDGPYMTTVSTRPPSRTGMRMSLGGGASSSTRTGIPVRPPSRLSTVSTTSSSVTGALSRSTTPYTRSPTPSGSARPPWGSNAGARERAASFYINGSHDLSSSTTAARRRTSSTFGASTTASSAKHVDLGASTINTTTSGKPSLQSGRRPMSTDLALGKPDGGTEGKEREGLARRASLALGRSMLRRPSSALGSASK